MKVLPCIGVDRGQEGICVGREEGCGEVACCGDYDLVTGRGGHFQVVGKPFYGVADSGRGGGGCPDVVALVVVHCGPKVETVFGVRIPAWA